MVQKYLKAKVVSCFSYYDVRKCVIYFFKCGHTCIISCDAPCHKLGRIMRFRMGANLILNNFYGGTESLI